MEQIYLENVRQIFLKPPKDNYYEGKGLIAFDNFVKLLGYIVPNKLTPEELIVYLKFLIKDIKDGVCRFQNSGVFKEIFENYLPLWDNLEVILTYFPSFMQVVSNSQFYMEFIKLFKESFYQLNTEDTKEKTYQCIEIKPDLIDISHKDKAEVLAALYNHSKPIGMGIAHYDPTPMSVDVARMLLKQRGYYYDYLKVPLDK